MEVTYGATQAGNPCGISSETPDGSSHNSRPSQLYQPLDPERKEIRVLQIEDDASKSLVHCHLEVVSLEDYNSRFRAFKSRRLRPPPVTLRSLEDYDLRSKPSKSEAPSPSVQDFASLNDAWIRACWKRGCIDEDCWEHECIDEQGHDCKHIKIPCWRPWPLDLGWWQMMAAFNISAHVQDPKMECNPEAEQDLPDLAGDGCIERHICLQPRFAWGDFEALSYCWESDVKDSLLVLNGRPTKVSRNLEAALQKIRHLLEVRSGMRIWCDALCIDQDGNTDEKNHQVGLMKDIYRNAFAVVTWLGAETAESACAFDGMAQLCVADANSYYTMHPQQTHEWLLRLPWDDILSLFSRNYWQRLWIIQESMLNQHMPLILCGSRRVPRIVVGFAANTGRSIAGSIFAAAVEAGTLFKELLPLSQLELYAIFDRIKSITSYHHSPPSEILYLGSKAKCKDPRDKIYGLLGLLPSTLSGVITPDYKKGVDQLYIEFARRFGTEMGFTSLLSWKSSDTNHDLGLPTWVPDWTGDFPRKHVQWLMERKAAENTSGPAFGSTNSHLTETRMLHCKAILVDKISSCSLSPHECLEDIKTPTSPQACGETPGVGHMPVESWTKPDLAATLALQRVMLMDHPYQHREPETDCVEPPHIGNIAWIDRLTSDEVHAQATDQEKPEWQLIMDKIMRSAHWERFNHFRKSNATFMIGSRPLQGFFRQDCSRLSDHDVHHMDLVVLTVNGRRLVTTSGRELLGLVPESARKDDLITVLHGCNFPVVLRPADPSLVTKSTVKPCYTYVGECYIDGLMDGEAINGALEGLEERDICLV